MLREPEKPSLNSIADQLELSLKGRDFTASRKSVRVNVSQGTSSQLAENPCASMF
jgi:hypothetical protein